MSEIELLCDECGERFERAVHVGLTPARLIATLDVIECPGCKDKRGVTIFIKDLVALTIGGE